jgi:LysM repeat protein
MEQGMLNNRQQEQLQGIAALGRNEDTYLAHVAPDEMIVPAQALRDNPLLKVAIEKSISNYGIDPNQFLVGNGSMDLNPLTGLPEFGFLSKVWKKAKKVVKAVAPIAVNFIPGIGPIAGAALTAAAGKASGLSTKQALLGGALSFAGGKLFGGNPAAGAAGKTATSTGGNIFSRAGEFLTKGKDGVGLFGNLGKGLGSMKEYAFKGKDGVGLFGNLGKTFMGGASELTVQPGESLSSIAAREGTTVAELLKANPSITNPNLIQAGAKLAMPGGGAGILSTLGTGARNLITGGGQPGQSQLGMIEDMLKGRPSDFSSEGSGRIGLDRNRFGGGQQPSGEYQGGSNLFSSMLGGLSSPMGLAGLTGLAAYMAAKKEEGGLSETPKVTMDQLGRYEMSKNLGTGGSRADFGLAPAPVALDFNMGGPVYGYNYGGPVRQYFNQGGLAMVEELDMRDGGESEGPGTGTSDDIPAMLSDGEFVMTAKATRGAGSFNVNKTKSGIELIKGGSASRKKGVENMRELMNIFEAV